MEMELSTKEELKEYLKFAQAIKAFKANTSAQPAEIFTSLLRMLDEFNRENNIDFEIPELQETPESIDSIKMQRFVNRFGKFIIGIKTDSPF